MILRDLLRPWLRVARPDDWTGKLGRVGLWPIYALVLLIIGIVRIPLSWWLLDSEVLTRVVLVALALYLFGWLRTLVWTLIPSAVILYGRRLWFRYRGRRIRVAVSALTAVAVEERPPPVGEVFVIEIGDGVVYDLCPVRWDGAARIHRVLARRVRRAEARELRRLARARKKLGPRPAGPAPGSDGGG